LKKTIVILVAVTVCLAFGIVFPANVSAHENRDVLGGKYQMRVGFVTEPAYQGLENAVYLGVCSGQCTSNRDTGAFNNGVNGLFDTLKVEVIYGSQSITLPFAPVPRSPGRYDAGFVPTRAGDYVFRIYGTINGDQIDEKFIPGPTTFDTVQPLTEVQFPDKLGYFQPGSSATAGNPVTMATQNPGATATTNNTAGNTAELQALKLQLLEQQKVTQQAKDNAAIAVILGISGIAVGGFCLLGIILVFLSRKWSRDSKNIERG
jgi:hypothetical protein